MKRFYAFFTLISFVIIGSNHITADEADIDELSLNFNQIKNLMSNFNNENLVKAIKFAQDNTELSKIHENRISKRITVRNESISKAQLVDSLPDDEAKSVDAVAQNIFRSSSYLLHMYCRSAGVPNKECVKFMSKYSLPESKLESECQKFKSTYLSFRRILPASYADGLSTIRTALSGKELPYSRTISHTLFKSGMDALRRQKNNLDLTTEEGILDEKRSLAVAQWTQFIEHDLSKPVKRSTSAGAPIECCDKESASLQPRYIHDSCYPLKVPSDDPNYKKFYVTCLNYVRSALAVNEQCKFGSINQLNQATSKLDLSQLYGYDEDDQSGLKIQGLLKTSTDDTSFLPKSTSTDACYSAENRSVCYTSGDSRVNANPIVTSLYTLFLRSHNQIAQKLKRMNPKWSDEQLFSVTKDINVAIFQKFIYDDWANAVLGKRLALDIRSKNDDHDHKSNRVSNEFGIAAIKFYNSMLPGDLFYQNDYGASRGGKFKSVENLIDSGRMRELMKLQDNFYQSRDLSRNNFFELLMTTVLRQRAMAMDSSYVDDLAIQLYRSKMHDSQVFGTDSLALDIQRSRDHGIPSYVNYIKKCLNIRITSWDDLRHIIKEDDLYRLRSIYESVMDVDLIVGGLSEIPNENATVGPTFSCILSDQLISSRLSDDNFYNRRSDTHGEKIAKTVENYTATRFICDNTKQKRVQLNIFMVPSDENPLINCSDYETVPKLDLSHFLIPSA